MTQNRLPKKIDPFRFAEKKMSLEGSISLDQMKRLSESILVSEGNVQVKISGDKDTEGYLYLSGTAKTQVVLCCQRCLKGVTCDIVARFVLSPVRNDAEAKALPSSEEPLMMIEEDEVGLIEMIEDELILALPLVPMHEPSMCSVKVAKESIQRSDSQTITVKPFSGLDQLLKK